ncbi:cupin domain-containing protein [Campylobacter troglodytis]|uniref:cupin domain-containing protein n=1 Tax=Campylobacter troglodytis TaxID=654363 RepID=UPI00115A4570|nr:cupin domain-containing protein [Campylobacter troglodytis]TQR59029.1 cupin domain-containing protein [Campylobacter troglodytis]
MSKFSQIDLGLAPRIELKEKLGLTGCEVSQNILAAGKEVPFYHAHKQNEELYVFLEGEGEFELDGQILAIKANEAVRVSPSVMRKIRAKSKLRFLCIQAKENSLTQWNADDGIMG